MSLFFSISFVPGYKFCSSFCSGSVHFPFYNLYRVLYTYCYSSLYVSSFYVFFSLFVLFWFCWLLSGIWYLVLQIFTFPLYIHNLYAHCYKRKIYAHCLSTLFCTRKKENNRTRKKERREKECKVKKEREKGKRREKRKG